MTYSNNTIAYDMMPMAIGDNVRRPLIDKIAPEVAAID